MSGCETCKQPGGKKDCPVHGNGDIELAGRPHGRMKYQVEGCKCEVCRLDARAYERDLRRRKAYGQVFLVDAEPARQHVAQLREFGIGWQRVALLAGLESSTVWRLLYGDPSRSSTPSKRIRPETERKILAVEATVDNIADGTPIPAVGARRRLQALGAIGWSQSQLGERLGICRGNMPAVIRSERLAAGTVRAIQALYEELWNSPPPEGNQWDRAVAARSRNSARARGWAPPMAWDDDTIDDPEAVPEGAGSTAVHGRKKLPELDDLLFLLETDSPERVAARFGVKVGSLKDALARAA